MATLLLPLPVSSLLSPQIAPNLKFKFWVSPATCQVLSSQQPRSRNTSPPSQEALLDSERCWKSSLGESYLFIRPITSPIRAISRPGTSKTQGLKEQEKCFLKGFGFYFLKSINHRVEKNQNFVGRSHTYMQVMDVSLYKIINYQVQHGESLSFGPLSFTAPF